MKSANNINVLNMIAYQRANHIWYGYQQHCRIYLDEYPEQKEERLSFFMRNWNLKSNAGIKRTA